MSVPRPAMFVEIVTAARLAGARDDLGFLQVILRIQHRVRDLLALQHAARALRSASTLTVPTRTGWLPCVRVLISFTTALYFSRRVL